jgi:hypothetical protein
VSAVKYELEFCITDDGILHSRRRENIKSASDVGRRDNILSADGVDRTNFLS